jgi:hypothetical protein
MTATFYPAIKWNKPVEFSDGKKTKVGDGFMRRLCSAYRHQVDSFAGFGSSAWALVVDRNKAAHQALLNNDIPVVASFVADPSTTNLFWGFEGLVAESIELFRRTPEIAQPEIESICDRIVRLGEAVGASSMWNPEAGDRDQPGDLEALLAAIEAKLGAKLDFPNPFPGEFGVRTSRGLVSYRPVQAVYQAWRTACLSRLYGGRVVEIGAGLGRNAYYARQMGLTDYTIVDLPLTIIAQAIFLGSVLGPDAVTLPGEAPKPGTVRLETPAGFHASQQPFDIAINVDSMTEMDREHAERYAATIVDRARIFLSINHEINPFRVHDLKALSGIPMQRHPYWMRKGYAEELFFLG